MLYRSCFVLAFLDLSNVCVFIKILLCLSVNIGPNIKLINQIRDPYLSQFPNAICPLSMLHIDHSASKLHYTQGGIMLWETNFQWQSKIVLYLLKQSQNTIKNISISGKAGKRDLGQAVTHG